MNLALFFAFIIVCHLFLMSKTFDTKHEATASTWWLRILLSGVIYDNSMLILAATYGTTDWLANYYPYRWLLHTMILPWAVLFTFSVLKQTGITSLQHRIPLISSFVITLVLITYGVMSEFVGLQLVNKTFIDTYGIFANMERFVSSHSGPPMATILTNLIVILGSIIVWRKAAWPWMFIGATTIFVINASAAASQYGFLFGNFAEVIFISGLIYTNRFIQDKTQFK